VDVDGDWFLEDKGTLDMDVVVNEKVWRELVTPFMGHPKRGAVGTSVLKGIVLGGVGATLALFIVRRFFS
jgi:hypothetical protein